MNLSRYIVMRLSASQKALTKSGMKGKQRQTFDDTWIFSLSSFPRVYNTEFRVQKAHFHGQSIGTDCVVIS